MCVIVFGIVEGLSQPGLVAASICSLLWCPIVGYFAGTTIGGIWLTADYLRKWADKQSIKQESVEANATSDKAIRHALDK